ncbi:type I polyketide synthase [Catellatospora sp. KI3]|uniref:SDR family NAD(P)-dependent oxidoreductase n=1 Tax=Catellatospora sp. KI3 TaxID=3041620 RepID=UPI0024827960|nr:type I polyketide synthase [Catellatospora sp. KI3]MDI1461274.1 type I polyketide synthase [Catellatospora sp. KI3]
MDRTRTDAEPLVAVIGMACRLPGGADDPQRLWQLLTERRDVIVARPADRDLPGPAQLPAYGGYLADVAGFDADFFGVSRREADVMDPQHRLLLEVAWEAFEHAGLPPERLEGSRTGVFTGISYTDYMERLAEHPASLEGSVLTNGACLAPGRLSYLLGLRGPSIAVDTACSSSLMALHLAGQALREGDCDVALAVGVSLMLWPRAAQAFARMGMLSPTARCRTFDAAADGFVRGEGCSAVVLKLLPDALRDGDRILAVVRASAANQDGHSDGIAAPSPDAQRALLAETVARAGIAAADVGLVEAHGTGTPVGDPIEFGALADVYGTGEHRCALGSVKTNLGHLEPAAGLTGLIKAVLCLQHGQIPANLHFDRWSGDIDAAATRFFVPGELTAWPVPDRERLAAVSSFGYAGTNVHVILEQAPPPRGNRPDVLARIPASRRPEPGGARPPHPAPVTLLVAAGSAAALPRAATRLADWLTGPGRGSPLHDVAHTLARHRSAGRGRLAVTAADRAGLVEALRAHAAGQAHPAVVAGAVGAGVTRAPVFVFSGQGSQWAGMGRALLRTEPAFAHTLTELDGLIRAEAGFSPLELIDSGQDVTGPGQVQPTLFAIQVALAAAYAAYGVRPAAVIGHSMGEVAAAVVAEALSPADGVAVICRRSALLARIAGTGGMATVSLDRAQVQTRLVEAGVSGSVSVAVLAGPSSTVIAGDAGQVRALTEDWQSAGVPAHLIAVDVASHSPQVESLLPELAQSLAGLRPRPPRVRLYSTAVAGDDPAPLMDAAYWCANLRQPVRFADAVTAAAADRHSVFVEVAPHPVVTHAVHGCLRGRAADPVVLGTLRRDADDPTGFSHALAALHCHGVPVDYSARYPGRVLTDAPALTFDRRRHWIDPLPERAAATGAGLPGAHVPLPDGDLWHGDAGTGALPWLADHRVHGDPVLPGAGFAALALTAAAAAFGTAPADVHITGLRLDRMLTLGEHTAVSTLVERRDPRRATVTVSTRDADGGWVRHAAAVLHSGNQDPAEPVADLAALLDAHPVAGDPAELYASMRRRGIEHGPAFAAVQTLHRSADGTGALARLRQPGQAGDLSPHPVLLDAALQTLVATLDTVAGTGLVLPVGLGTLRLHGDPATAVYCQARRTGADGTRLTGSLRLLDAHGRTVLTAERIELARRQSPVPDPGRWFLEPHWRPAVRPPDGSDAVRTGHWLVLGERDTAFCGLVARGLRLVGASASTLCVKLGDDPLGPMGDALADRWAARTVVPQAVVLICDDRPAADAAATALARVRRLLDAVQAMVAAWADPPRLYVVTRGAHRVEPADRVDLALGALRGVLRALAWEHPRLRATQIDVAGQDVPGLVAELLAAVADDEVALRGPQRFAARLAYAPVTAQHRRAATTRTVRFGQDAFRLRAAQLGDLESLVLTGAERRPPGAGEVEIRVTTAGVNFRDVLTTLGLLPGRHPGDDVGARIGFECAGVVSAVGEHVTDLRPGDVVAAVDLRGGAFGSFVTVPADMAVRVPRQLDPADAAGVPAVFLTAWYALHDVARLAEGEQVLIHSAAGGTGLAAIAVARLLGARVLATAGTEEKRAYLRGLGIEHVMDSRGLDFAEQTRAASGGGVDVVLNSLSGAAVRAGLETLRPFGRFVELGVRDIIADAPLGLAPLRHNVTISAVDLIEVQRQRPQRFAAMLRELMAHIAAGRLSPPRTRRFPLLAAPEAMRTMAGGRHLGKLVLTVPDSGTAEAVYPARSPVRADGAYIVSGGLRGVGLATAEWLAAAGARRLVLNGRGEPGPQVRQRLAALVQGGTDVVVVRGDISEPGVAERLVAAAGADGAVLRGVVHSAMVLADAAVTNVDDADLSRVWAPKVTGAWRLHEAVGDRPLDWFVAYSSMSALIGNGGQAGYAAANSWLDTFAAWRSAQGQPTLAVGWGPWGQTGAATDFAERGYETIPTEEGLRALGELLTHGRVHTGVIPGPPQSWLRGPARDCALFAELVDAAPAAAGTADIVARLRELPGGPERQVALEGHLAEHIRTVLQLGAATLDPQTPLRSLGFDSLLTLELRSRLENELRIRLHAKFVWHYPTLAALAAAIAEQLDLDRERPTKD